MSEYEGCVVSSDREPENRITVTVDAEGYVCGPVHRSKDAGSTEFFALLRRTPIAPMIDVEMGGYPVDENGRGLSVLEMEQRNNAAQERAA